MVTTRREPVEIAMRIREDGLADWALDPNGELRLDGGLVSSILTCLWTDNRLEDGEEHPHGESGDDPRGWWGEGERRVGSGVWKHLGHEATTEKRRRVEIATEKALSWLLELGIAESITVIGTWIARGLLRVSVGIKRGTARGWPHVWSVDPVDHTVKDELGNELRIVSY